jgi:hypothetical protein
MSDACSHGARRVMMTDDASVDVGGKRERRLMQRTCQTIYVTDTDFDLP